MEHDIKKLDEILTPEVKELINQECINEDYIWLTTNIRKLETGLPCNISIQVETDDGKKYQHNLPRLKFQNNTFDKITSQSDLIPISISDDPVVLISKSYDNKLYKQVRKWILLNKDNLLLVWNQELSEFEFMKIMKKV